ncbi:helix-turn-helix domain-containing protein [Salinicoccus sp. Marseille-QA3877]
MSIGSNIKKLRKERKKTQQELANEIGISRTYLTDLENNKRNTSMNTLQKIADKLNVSTYYLQTGQPSSQDLIKNDPVNRFIIKNEEDLKRDLKYLTETKLSTTEVSILNSVILFIGVTNPEVKLKLAAILKIINRDYKKLDNDELTADERKETLNSIETTTGYFNEFIKEIYGFKEGD